MSSSDQTINIPQLLLIIVLGGLALRYFFFSSSSTTTANHGASSANNVRAREADVERIQQMFPQVSRRSIMWDLQRNGGNVVATTERILSGRGLEVVSAYLHLLSACSLGLCSYLSSYILYFYLYCIVRLLILSHSHHNPSNPPSPSQHPPQPP